MSDNIKEKFKYRPGDELYGDNSHVTIKERLWNVESEKPMYIIEFDYMEQQDWTIIEEENLDGMEKPDE